MASINRSAAARSRTVEAPRTHGGAKAARVNKRQQLERSVMSCLLWEKEFYEEGQSIVDRIKTLVAQVDAHDVANIAIRAKRDMRLRHVPLLLAVEMAKTKHGRSYLKYVIPEIITRADDIPELLSIYWKDGKKPIAKQLKKHLGEAFRKFDEYQLGKYKGGQKAVKLRDILRMLHIKPDTKAQAALWGRVMNDQLAPPDTWEVALSAGADKKETFTRLLKEEKLGYLALLRNLRNMDQAGVNTPLIKKALLEHAGVGKMLPWQFIAAAKNAPKFEREIDQAFINCLDAKVKLKGRTVVVVDISGSMHGSLSTYSDMNRLDASCALATIIAGSCEDAVVYATAGNDGLRRHATDVVPPRSGMALVDAIKGMNAKLGGGGIFLKQVCDYIESKESSVDRMIVITDEQDCSSSDKDRPALAEPLGSKTNYLVNVSSTRNGIGYGKWVHIDGFSQAVVTYIAQSEASLN